MAYTPNIWVDREGTTRYFETVDNDGALIFTPDYTQVTEMGTPVNADNMNHIEEGIADHDTRIEILEANKDDSNYLKTNQITNCILEAPNGVATYSGSTITVAPGVKVLIPNGRNPDGTLNNIEYTTKSELSFVSDATGKNMFGVIDAEWGYIWDGFAVVESETQPLDSEIYRLWYQPSTNIMRWHQDVNSGWRVVKVAVFANYDRTQGVVSNFNAKEPFRAMEYMPLTEAHVVVETYQNGTSWYRVWSDGWCEQGGMYTTSGTYTFLKSFRDTNYTWVNGGFTNSEDTVTYLRDAAINRTATSFYVTAGQASTWYACGYIY